MNIICTKCKKIWSHVCKKGKIKEKNTTSNILFVFNWYDNISSCHAEHGSDCNEMSNEKITTRL